MKHGKIKPEPITEILREARRKNEAERKRSQARVFSEICGMHSALRAIKAVHFCRHRL